MSKVCTRRSCTSLRRQSRSSALLRPKPVSFCRRWAPAARYLGSSPASWQTGHASTVSYFTTEQPSSPASPRALCLYSTATLCSWFTAPSSALSRVLYYCHPRMRYFVLCTCRVMSFLSITFVAHTFPVWCFSCLLLNILIVEVVFNMNSNNCLQYVCNVNNIFC